jgi:hypothetical protein
MSGKISTEIWVVKNLLLVTSYKRNKQINSYSISL